MEILYVLGFAIFWCGLSWYISIFGWAKLSRAYKTNRKSPADLYYSFGSINWFDKVFFKIGFLPEGLYVSVLLISRVAHPPLLVPWVDVKIEDQSLIKHISLGTPEIAQIILSHFSGLLKMIKEQKMQHSNAEI